jgi:Cys-rich repeat protein
MSTDRPRHHRIHRAGAWALAVFALFTAVACSLLVENSGEQCQSDKDCGSGFRCEKNICVTAAGIGGSGGMSTSSASSSSSSSSSGTTCDVDGGIQGGGCFDCEPTSNAELLNHCTDSQCFPFDNAKRIEALADGGKLPPLPTPDGG